MRIANVSHRLCLIQGSGAIDVHDASGGRFGPDAAAVYPRWAEFARRTQYRPTSGFSRSPANASRSRSAHATCNHRTTIRSTY